jgi:hypothetical protein
MAFTEAADLTLAPGFEFLRPLVTGWVSKFEAAKRARSHWNEVSAECEMFYSKSAAAMWNPQYERKFWRGVKAPKFRISLNKAFEFVAIFAPNLMWDVPFRNVEPKRMLRLPDEMMQYLAGAEQQMQAFQQAIAQQGQPQIDPQTGAPLPTPPMPDPGTLQALMPALQLSQMIHQLAPMQSQSEMTDSLVAYLLQTWLNYTPREQKSGLIGESELALVDALVKGRGVMMTKTYKMPTSEHLLTGSFRERPENLLIDPDFTRLEDAKWIAIRRVDAHWELERRFRLPKDSLKGRASLESNWHYGEAGFDHKQDGQSNDLVVWYEVFSKSGPGTRLSGLHLPVRERLEEVVGDYAYLCIAPSVPYPLNCTSMALRHGGPYNEGLTDEEVRQAFAWPIPYWADDRWPVEVLDFYKDNESSWPIPPIAPGLGELKFLNFLVPWAANRIYSSSRDFWAVAGPHVDHYTKYLQEGLDQTIIPTPVGVADVRQAIQVLTQPETRFDVWKIIELVSELFDKRTGLTEMAYGMNPGGTQSRSAEDAIQKSRAVGVRPDHMRRKVVEWQSALSSLEAFCARWFISGDDVAPLLGPLGKTLWEQFVMSTDIELVVREMKYTVAASSIRRPDRDRDVANLQQFGQVIMPAIQAHMQATGDVTGFNGFVQKWGEYHDMRVDQFQLPPPAPPQPDPKLQIEMAKGQTDLQRGQMELQGKTLDLQGKQLELQAKELDAQSQAQGQAAEMASLQTKLLGERASHIQAMQHQAEKFQQERIQDALGFRQDLAEQALMADVKRRAAARPKTNGKA